MLSRIINSTRFIILGAILISIITGCSAGSSNPIIPDSDIVQIQESLTFEVTPENGGNLERKSLVVSIQPEMVSETVTVEVSTFFSKGIIGGVSLKPHGMTFSSPIMLIMPLFEKQIPGSRLPVSYRAFPEDKWEPATLSSGMPVNSIVSDDGLSLLMFIDHFSEYAVLAYDLAQSTLDITSDTVYCDDKPFGDGFLVVPANWYIFEDGIDQIAVLNDETGISNGLALLPGLEKGLSDPVVRYNTYKEILSSLILQPEFPDPDNQLDFSAIENNFMIIHDYFDYAFQVTHIEADTAEEVMELTGKYMDTVDLAPDIFRNIVNIKKVTKSEFMTRALQHAGHLKDFKYTYQSLLIINDVCAAQEFFEDMQDVGFFMADRVQDLIIGMTMNYVWSQERINALKPIINQSNDDSLKAAFDWVEYDFGVNNKNRMINTWLLLFNKHNIEAQILGANTFIDAAKLAALSYKTLITFGWASKVAGASVASPLFLAGLIIMVSEFYYEELYQAYQSLLKCTLMATFRHGAFGNIHYTEADLLNMNPNQRRTAMHLMLMKIYCVYYYYQGMADIYDRWDWVAQLIGTLRIAFGDADWWGFWDAAHLYLGDQRDYWKSEYFSLIPLLGEDTVDETPPVWTSEPGIYDATPSDQQVTITWNEAHDQTSPPVKYLLYKNSWTSTPIEVSTNAPYTWTGLENGRTYYFGVRCKDSANPSNIDTNTKVLSAIPTEGSTGTGNLIWAKSAGSELGNDLGIQISTLSDNSTVITGIFGSMATFGRNEANQTTLSSAGSLDVFIARYNTNGNLAWAKRAGGLSADIGRGITTLSDDSSVITGEFDGTAKFGQGEINETILISNGSYDIFIARYNPDGSLAWAKCAGGSGEDLGKSITTLSDNSFVVSGHFRGSAVFGQDEINETILTSVGDYDIFVARYNQDGTLAWVKSAGGPNSDHALGITSLSDNSTVMTGYFLYAATFGLGEPNQTILTSNGSSDIYVTQYNPDGSLAWAKCAGGSDDDVSSGITTLSDNSTVVTGYFHSIAIFGQSESNQTILTSAGYLDIFVAQYNPDGSLAWAKSAGGFGNDIGDGITTLSDNSTVVTGSFVDSATFGSGEQNQTVLTSAGSHDIFIVRYNPNGTLEWAKHAGSIDDDFNWGGITTLSDNSTVVTGLFGGISGSSAVFGLGELNETILTSAGYEDIFVARFAP